MLEHGLNFLLEHDRAHHYVGVVFGKAIARQQAL